MHTHCCIYFEQLKVMHMPKDSLRDHPWWCSGDQDVLGIKPGVIAWRSSGLNLYYLSAFLTVTFVA